jgi:tetratricopeptide (TPR) repeat protein
MEGPYGGSIQDFERRNLEEMKLLSRLCSGNPISVSHCSTTLCATSASSESLAVSVSTNPTAEPQRTRRLRRKLRNSSQIATSIFLLVFSSLTLVRSQTTSVDRVVTPPRKDLVPLYFPDLSNLEEGVREQIAKLQDSLAVIVKDPKTSDAALSDAYGKLGQLYHAYSLSSPARDSYFNANRLSPTDFRWVYLLAKLDQQEGRFDEAISKFRIARTLRPDYVAVPVNLANIFLELNQLDAAVESFNAALQIDPNNPAAHYGLGQVSISKHNYAQAVDHFEKTLGQVPGANRVHYSLAMAYRGLGDADKAKAHLAQQGTVGVRVSDPLVDALADLIEGERVYLSRGKLAFEAKRYADAVIEFRKAVAAKPDSVTARINLGAALTQIGDVKGAVEQFEEALRIEPGKANAHYNLAVLLARQNKHEEAIEHLRAALSVDKDDLSARVLLAQELLRSEHFDEALTEFARVVQADPNNEAALFEQVRLLYRTGQFKQGLQVIEMGHTQYPQKGRTALMLSYVLSTSPELELRNGTRALDLAQRIYKATGAVQHGVLIGMALAELGRCSEASGWQRRLILDAERAGNTDLLAKLRAGLTVYEDVKSCRPAADKSLNDLPF